MILTEKVDVLHANEPFLTSLDLLDKYALYFNTLEMYGNLQDLQSKSRCNKNMAMDTLLGTRKARYSTLPLNFLE